MEEKEKEKNSINLNESFSESKDKSEIQIIKDEEVKSDDLVYENEEDIHDQVSGDAACTISDSIDSVEGELSYGESVNNSTKQKTVAVLISLIASFCLAGIGTILFTFFSQTSSTAMSEFIYLFCSSGTEGLFGGFITLLLIFMNKKIGFISEKQLYAVCVPLSILSILTWEALSTNFVSHWSFSVAFHLLSLSVEVALGSIAFLFSLSKLKMIERPGRGLTVNFIVSLIIYLLYGVAVTLLDKSLFYSPFLNSMLNNGIPFALYGLFGSIVFNIFMGARKSREKSGLIIAITLTLLSAGLLFFVCSNNIAFVVQPFYALDILSRQWTVLPIVIAFINGAAINYFVSWFMNKRFA